MRPALLLLVLATALLGAGCGAVKHLDADDGNAERGKTLFMAPDHDGKPGCGACHALADAGTTGTIGPNLDDAFRYVKCQGFDESTIRDVIRGQIAYSTENPRVDVNDVPVQGMPPNIVVGQDAKDVAIYVAQVAGNGECTAEPAS